MVLDAVVQEDGTLIAKAPKVLWGKKVQLTIKEKPLQEEILPVSQENTTAHDGDEDDKSASLTQWEEMSAIFKEVDKLDIPHRTIDAILHELHEFRESE